MPLHRFDLIEFRSSPGTIRCHLRRTSRHSHYQQLSIISPVTRCKRILEPSWRGGRGFVLTRTFVRSPGSDRAAIDAPTSSACPARRSRPMATSWSAYFAHTEFDLTLGDLPLWFTFLVPHVLFRFQRECDSFRVSRNEGEMMEASTMSRGRFQLPRVSFRIRECPSVDRFVMWHLTLFEITVSFSGTFEKNDWVKWLDFDI